MNVALSRLERWPGLEVDLHLAWPVLNLARLDGNVAAAQRRADLAEHGLEIRTPLHRPAPGIGVDSLPLLIAEIELELGRCPCDVAGRVEPGDGAAQDGP
jgi:hypothetical protein